jgi:HK97 family phage major capsid protein
MSFAAERQAREERKTLLDASQPTIEKLQRGERLSVEERTALDEQHKRIAELNAEVRTYEEARALSEAASASVGSTPAPETDAAEARERDFSAFLKRGTVTPELRAAGEASGSAGGYLVPPGWWQRLQVALKAYGGIARDFEQIETESGQPMQWATVNPTAVIGTLLAENTQVSTQDYTFGQGQLGAYMYTSNAQLVSIQLANDSAFNVDKFVQARVGESLGRAQAAAAISGTGSSQPLGIITALAATSSVGTVNGGAISQNGGFLTLQAGGAVQMGTGSSTTELLTNTLNPNTIRSMIAAIDPAYRNQGAKFYFNDMQVLGLRGQTDSNGRPLINLQDGLMQGSPGRLWNYDIEIDPNIPALAASTTGGPVFGHLQSAMVLRTVNQAGLLRLTERYADFLQIGFIGFARWDIRSNDLRAAVTVKAAAT